MVSNKHDRLIICADDFAYTEGISSAILSLIEMRKINATSVMVESPLLPNFALKLLRLLERENTSDNERELQIGLHFNLTECFPLSSNKFDLSSLILLPLSSKRAKLIQQTLLNQLILFEETFDRAPDFIDGHQHVHIFPSLREVFLETISQRYANDSRKPWIRQVSPSFFSTDAYFKVCVLRVLNMGFRKKCRACGLKYNKIFQGVYSLNDTHEYQKMLDHWLQNISSGGVIMCHPSLDYFTGDPIAAARIKEYQVLKNLEGLLK